MKLYTYAGAPNPRRVHIFLAEKGIEIPFQKVDIMTRENRQPEFMEKINPVGGIPVLELDDGSHIAESISICRYFEAQQPEPSLFGRTPEEIARIDMWLRRVELGLMTPVGLVWVHGNPLTARVMKQQIPEVAEQNREVVARYYEFLDRQLEGREFLAGDQFSIADIVLLCTYDFADQLNKLTMAAEHERLAAWHARVSARPSAQA